MSRKNNCILKNKWLWIIVTLTAVITLFIVNVCLAIGSDSNNSNVFTVISGWVSFLATAGVGVIAFVQNHKYKKENEKMLVDTNKKAVLPYIFLQQIDYKLRQDGFAILDNSDSENYNEEKEYGYRELNKNIYFFEVLEDRITSSVEETELIKEYKANAGHKVVKQGNAKTIKTFNANYCPFYVQNVGQGAATFLSVAIQKNDEQNDDTFIERIYFGNLLPGSEIGLNIYFAENLSERDKYYIIFEYQNIFGDSYEQKYSTTKKQKQIEIDSSYKQKEKQEQQNG